MQTTLDPDLLEDIDIKPNVIEMLEHRAAAVRREIESIDQEIKELESRINQQFTDLRKYGYRIHSVFIHRGSVSFGHYWIYIYDFQKRLFRKYNDQYVTEVTDETEVFKHSVEPGSSPPTPYFLGMSSPSWTVTVHTLTWFSSICPRNSARHHRGGEARDGWLDLVCEEGVIYRFLVLHYISTYSPKGVS